MPAYDPKLSHFDLDAARGTQAELWIADIRKALGNESERVEVKRDAWFVHRERFYVETECHHRDGVWRPSGIMTTKSKLWVFVMGGHPGCVIVEVDWLRRARDLAAQDKRNHASCDYGENPTRGCYVYMRHLIMTRGKAIDEH